MTCLRIAGLSLVLVTAAWSKSGWGTSAEKGTEPPASAPAAPSGAAITDDDVKAAIDKAGKYLMKQEQADGQWPEQANPISSTPCGTSELALYALSVSDIEHAFVISVQTGNGSWAQEYNPEMLLAMAVMRGQPLDRTLAVSLRVLALARASIRSSTYDRNRPTIKKAAEWLIAAQGSHGGWGEKSLEGGNGKADLGHTHMAVLALSTAATFGAEVPPAVWERAMTYLYKTQLADGS